MRNSQTRSGISRARSKGVAAAAAKRSARSASAISSAASDAARLVGRQNVLERHTVPLGENRAQALVSRHHVGQRRFQSALVEVSLDTPCHRDVVGGAGTFQAVEEPQPLLRERQRQTIGPWLPYQWNPGTVRRRRTRVASSATVGASKTARIGSSTPRMARTCPTTRVASSEWPPKCEEVVVDSDALQLKNIGEDMAERDFVAGCAVRGIHRRLAFGAGRARRSSLPLDVSGRPSRMTKAAGTM